MTAVELCATCGEGRIVSDPQTGDERCQNCGSRPDATPPVVLGGQGRSAEDLEREAASLQGFAVGCVLTAVVLVTAYAVWGLPS